MKVVVGLGNVGAAYRHTRHNAGFEVVEELARRAGSSFRRVWYTRALVARANVKGEEALLVKPTTLMNRSGTATAAVVRKKGIDRSDMLVVLDDADLPIGSLRLRREGGAGGHRGLKSVLEGLGPGLLPRLRVGIGRSDSTGMVDHVLARFRPEERDVMGQATLRAADMVECWATEGIDAAMNRYNG